MMDEQSQIGSTTSRPRRRPILRMRFVVASCVCILCVLGSSGEVLPIRSSMQLTRWKEFSYARETRQAAGRTTVLEATRRTGYIVLGNGEFARLAGWIIHTTTPEGKACYEGLVTYDFPDGSSILARVDAFGDPRGKQVGSITFVSGTKRFEGITGRGTLSHGCPVNGTSMPKSTPNTPRPKSDVFVRCHILCLGSGVLRARAQIPSRLHR